MKFSTASAAAFAGLAAAAPTTSSLDVRANLNDGQILNYALTLEHLENTFYRQGLNKFSAADFKAAGYGPKVYANLKRISSDEKTHVSFLTTALKAAGVRAVPMCTYDFPMGSVDTFLATASVLEGVGVSAYLGAAHDIMNKQYLTAAGSILTTEARHSAYIRNTQDQAPFAQPFDNPLDFNEVYTLAAPFIKSCPKNSPMLPLKAFPALTAASPAMIKTGSVVKLVTKAKMPKAKIYGAFITVTGPIFVRAKKVQGGWHVKVPKGVKGQSYAVLNKGNKAVTDDTIFAGPAILEIM